jgi:hypothetical protein
MTLPDPVRPEPRNNQSHAVAVLPPSRAGQSRASDAGRVNRQELLAQRHAPELDGGKGRHPSTHDGRAQARTAPPC